MKVALVYPDFPDWNVGGCYYTGVAALSASLKRAGHDVMFMHITGPIDKEQFVGRLKEYGPRIIGFSATTPMFKYVKEWAPWAKEIADAIVVCGGVHARMDPDGVINTADIDAVCYGEGDGALVELCSRLENNRDFTTTENFIFKKGSTIISNPLQFVEDLDELPDPDRDIFDHQKLYDYSKKGAPSVATFMFSRGCPFSCSYCSNARLMEGYPRSLKRVRYLSPKRAVGQIVEHLRKHPDTDYVRIDDSNVSLNREWLYEFCRLYKEKVSKPYMCQTRIGPRLLDEDVVRTLIESGCFMLILGVEHGSEEYRRRVLGREMSDDDIIAAFKLCHKHRLATRAFAMFGTPYETVGSMLETIKLLARSEVFDLSAGTFYPFPHTVLDDLCRKEGFTIGNLLAPGGWPAVILAQPTVTTDAVCLVWRMSRTLLLLYALCYRGSSGSERARSEKILDDCVQSMIEAMTGRVTRELVEGLTQSDSVAHRAYKMMFHPNICAHCDLVLRV